MQDRLSFREFKDELLLNIAILTKGETNKFINPADAAEGIEDKFSATWIMSAAEEWRSAGYLHGQTFLSGGGSYALTGAGLEHAEDVADERATDLYELIDEANAVPLADDQRNTLTDGKGNRLEHQVDLWDQIETLIVKIDHLSPDFKSLDRALRDQIDVLRGNNALLAEDAEAGQRLAELEAGKALLRADQADASLIKRLLIPSLTWFSKKVGDETVSTAIQALIGILLTWLATKT